MKVRISIPVEFEVEGDNMVDVAYNWWDLKRKIIHYGWEEVYVEEAQWSWEPVTYEFLDALQYVEEEEDNSVEGYEEWLKNKEE